MTQPGNGRPVFTPARMAALKSDWEAGLDADKIAYRLNELPGLYPVLGANAVRHKASAMGLKRPEGWLLARKKVAVPVTWTEERLELLRNLINLIPDADVLERINSLPGPLAKSIEGMRDKAQRMGYLAARPKPPGQVQPTWSDERLAFLRENYGRIRLDELLERLQAMPGAPIGSIKTVRGAAVRHGIRSSCILRSPPPRRAPQKAKPRAVHVAAPAPEPAPEPLTLQEQEAIVAQGLAEREAKALAMFAKGQSATTVAAALKLPLREAFRLQGAARERKAA